MYSSLTLSTLQLFFVLVVMTAQSNQQQILQYHIAEGQPVDTFVADVRNDIHLQSNYTASDYAKLRFAFKFESKLFRVDNVTGVIRTARVLDREALCPGLPTCEQTVVVVLRPMQFYALVRVTITVDDVNDHAPSFPNASFVVEVSPATPRGSLFQIPSAEDADQGQLGVRGYHLERDYGMFELQVTELVDGSQDVRLRLTGQPERRRSYNLTVIATDGGSPPRTGQMTVMFVVRSVQDSSFAFVKDVFEVHLVENAAILSPVIQVRIRDQPGSGEQDRIVYGISNDTLMSGDNTGVRLLAINSATGQVYVNGVIDFEKDRVLRATLTASIAGRHRTQQTAVTLLIVNVLDTNDNAPHLKLNTFTVSGKGAVLENAQTGTFVAHVTVTDPDLEENSRCLCYINNPSKFVLESIASSEYKISTAVSFDREQQSSHVVTLTCHDHGKPSLTSSVDLDVDILDENDNWPRFAREIYVTGIEENKVINEKVLRINASDEDIGRNAELLYGLIPTDSHVSVLSINPHTGELYTNTVLDHERQSQYSFQLTVSDRGIPVLSSDATLILNVSDLNDNAPRFVNSFYIFNATRRSPIGTVLGTVNAIDEDLSSVHRILSYTLEDKIDHVSIDYDSGEIITASDLTSIGQFQFVVRAANTLSNLPLYDLVNVAVIVYNKLPVFKFPSLSNNTVEIHPDTKSGQLITCLEVVYDEPLNLRYTIVSGSHQDLFTLDRLNGCIYINSKLDVNIAYMLRISVGDFNEPSEQVTSAIWLVPGNYSAAEPVLGTLSLVHANNHLFVILCIGCGMAGLFSVVIVLAVAILRYHRKRNRCYGDYNCREEALRLQTEVLSEVVYRDHVSNSNSSEVGDLNAHTNMNITNDSNREMNGVHRCGTVANPARKEVTFCLDRCPTGSSKQLSWMMTTPDILHTHVDFEMSRPVDPWHRPTSPGGEEEEGGSMMTSQCSSLSDGQSGSLTDSGKGVSEEGGDSSMTTVNGVGGQRGSAVCQHPAPYKGWNSLLIFT